MYYKLAFVFKKAIFICVYRHADHSGRTQTHKHTDSTVVESEAGVV